MQADRKMDISMCFFSQKTDLLVICKIDLNGSLFLRTFEFFLYVYTAVYVFISIFVTSPFKVGKILVHNGFEYNVDQKNYHYKQLKISLKTTSYLTKCYQEYTRSELFRLLLGAPGLN